MPVTQISDLIVPEMFTAYTIKRTAEKSRLIQSGAVAVDATISDLLSGGGLTFHVPSYRDLANDLEDISNDDPAILSVPSKITTQQEIAVRISRNKSWSSMDLNGRLSGDDPMGAIGELVSDYWVRRQQAAFVATLQGLFANNDTATDSYHTQGDLKFDASGAAFVDGVTNFNASATIDAIGTMGDSLDGLSLALMHSLVYRTAQKRNLIDFVQDSVQQIQIPTYLGRQVIIDDHLPNTGGVFETWFVGQGAIRLGTGSPRVPTELARVAAAGNGSGQEILHNRVEWCFHPAGHAYVGTAPNGGPSNANTSNNLAAAGSWRRAFAERKQINIARLVTREY